MMNGPLQPAAVFAPCRYERANAGLICISAEFWGDTAMEHAIIEAGRAGIDLRLLQEAFRRACRAPMTSMADRAVILAAIIAEARKGTCHMHGLVRAGSRAV